MKDHKNQVEIMIFICVFRTSCSILKKQFNVQKKNNNKEYDENKEDDEEAIQTKNPHATTITYSGFIVDI